MVEEIRQRLAELEAENRALREQLRLARPPTDPSADSTDEHRLLEILNETGAALGSEHDLDRLVQTVTDAGVELAGAAFGAFFYNATDAAGQHLMLYALSGAPREAFAQFPMPRSTAVFGPTFAGAAIVRSDDITQDPRYGHSAPHRGMPPGHLPVRSYLAVPVISRSGAVLGGLFFGHPQAGVFTERTERIIKGIAAQAAIAVDNARLFQDVQHSEQRFRALIENSADGIAVTDADNAIRYLSSSGAAINGITSECAVGRSAFEGTHPDDLPLQRAALHRLLERADEPVPLVWRRKHKDGRWLWLEGVCTNRLADPAVGGIITNFRDITTRKRAEQAQKMESLGTLAGGIAHDFNNILLAIRANTQLAIEDLPADHAAQPSLAEIVQGARRASDLVQRILMFSRAEEPSKKVVELPALVDEALALVRSSVTRSIELRTRYAAAAPPVLADPTQIHQVLINLVNNAVHAIGASGGSIEVAIEPVLVTAELAAATPALREGRYARLSVVDTGCGIPAAALGRIFEPFFTTKAVGEGTGLGLSVVHGIVRGHDGALTVASEPGRTTFQLYFPATEPVAPAVIPAAPVARSTQRVMYVDDEDAIVRAAGRALRRHGYDIVGFTRAEQALAAFEAAPHDFHVLVTDLSMPGMTGFALAREVRKLRPELPIIMISGYLRPEDWEQARSCGIEHLLHKTGSMRDLATTLGGVLAGR
ncbi:MAG: PAS domain-containing hybrid sensor histidine kinase/response regulator [Kofleriaceae bacterium]